MEKTSLKKTTLLIVDDDALFRRVLKEELGQAGYQIREAGTGEAGLAELRKDCEVSLAFLDYWLPDTNGVDLLKRVKESRPDCPVVILSAHTTEEIGSAARTSGVFRYLEKPYDLLELLPLIESALDGEEYS